MCWDSDVRNKVLISLQQFSWFLVLQVTDALHAFFEAGDGEVGEIERDQDVTKSRTQQRVRNNGLALYGRKEIPDFLDFQDFYANLQLPH